MDNTGEKVNKSLAGTAFRALKWRYVGTALQVGLQFSVALVLARHLSPEAFGLVGMALIPIGFGKLIGDLGFGVAIIQRSVVTEKHVRAAYTGSTIMGIVLFLMLWFLAPAVSRLFNHEGLTSILRITGVSFIFFGMSATPISILRRQLRFRALAGIESGSYMVGYGIVGISLALLGYGAWSLVAANIVQPLCLAILTLGLTKQSVGLYFGLREYRNLIRLGSAEVLNNLTNYTADNLTFFVIGRYVGAPALGLYRRASDLIRIPLWHSSVALLTVMFPLYSTIQEDIPRLRRAHLQTVSLTAMITMPVLFAIAVVPEIVIGGLFGEPWKVASTVLQLLCLGGPFTAIIHVLGALSHARGYVFNEWRRQLVYLIATSVFVVVLLPFGMEGVALAATLAIFVRYAALSQLSISLVMCGWKDFSSAHLPGLILAVPVSIAVYLFASLTATLQIADPLQLLMTVTVGLLSLIMSFLFLPSAWLGNLYPWIIDRFGSSLPPWVHIFMTAKLAGERVQAADRGLL